MKLNINWNIIPTYTLDVKDLSCPYDISLYMKSLAIKKYIYRIMFKGIVLKFGMSADNSRVYGERLYRQIGHCKSWGNKRINGPSGADFRIIEEDFNNLYNFPIEKDFLKLKIWDLTKYPFETLDPWSEILAIESSLIQQYKDIVGEKPIGNLHDDENIFRKPAIKITTWARVFQ